MTTIDFITDLFCCVDDKLTQADNNQKHTQAKLYPSEVVTLALLFALKGGGNRAFYRWIERDYKALFPNLPKRTRLFRLFNRHHRLTDLFRCWHYFKTRLAFTMAVFNLLVQWDGLPVEADGFVPLSIAQFIL